MKNGAGEEEIPRGQICDRRREWMRPGSEPILRKDEGNDSLRLATPGRTTLENSTPTDTKKALLLESPEGTKGKRKANYTKNLESV